jgi:hypothetical protein
MKDDLNDEMPNGTLSILIILYGVLNWDGVLKSGDMLERTTLHISKVA